jgi:uncharacterized protein (TIGR03083 family)
MDAKATWLHIDEQRADLADFLETLTADQWNTPSLCAGWTVRDVGVHLTQSAASWPRIAWEVARSGLRFNEAVARVAREDASTPEQLVATLRGMVGGRRRPPGTAVADPLMDILVHGQDIAIPLGIDRRIPVEPAVVAAERLWAMGFRSIPASASPASSSSPTMRTSASAPANVSAGPCRTSSWRWPGARPDWTACRVQCLPPRVSDGHWNSRRYAGVYDSDG